MTLGKQTETRKVLYLAASPKGIPKLRIDEEERLIKDSLKRSPQRDKFNVQAEPAVTIGHIRRALLEHQPEIVHFGGHGAGADGLVCEDETGQVKLIPTSALADLLDLARNHVRCVVLNACFAEVQADEVVKHIDYVVGMKYSIGDRAALKFTEGFYDALFSGSTFTDSFRYGVNAIKLESIPEDSTPVIKTKNVTDPPPPAKVTTVRPRPKPAPVKEVPTPSRVRAATPWALLVLVIITAGLISVSHAWTDTPGIQPLVGSYTQETYDKPFEDPETGFRVESVHTMMAVSADPVTGKLSTVNITTNQISYMPYQNKVITTYTAEWRYKEVERVSPTVVQMVGSPYNRFSFDEINMHGLMPEEVAKKFDEFKQKINRRFQTCKAELRLAGGGQLQNIVTYNGGHPKTQPFIRN